MKRLVICLTALLAGAAYAEEGPSFDCTHAAGMAEEMICADAGLQALDRRLAEVYGRALAKVRGLEAEAELKAMQRGWIKGRNDCWKAAVPRECIAAAYSTRSAELVARWTLDEPYSEAAWQCGDDAGNLVYAFYFETEPPALRLERGEAVVALVQAAEAMGASYEGAFGQMFREEGGTADLIWSDQIEETCILVAG